MLCNDMEMKDEKLRGKNSWGVLAHHPEKLFAWWELRAGLAVCGHRAKD